MIALQISYIFVLLLIFVGFLQGLEYCHQMAVMHRDIKAANILLTDSGVVKLSTFIFLCILLFSHMVNREVMPLKF